MKLLKTSLPIVLSALVVPGLLFSTARAATITWQPSVNMYQGSAANESFVNTNGSLVVALNASTLTTGSVTVNGVTFPYSPNNVAVPGVGGATITLDGGTANVNAFQAAQFGGNANVVGLIQGGIFGITNVTLGGLTPGKKYVIQVFANDARNTRNTNFVSGYGGTYGAPLGKAKLNNAFPSAASVGDAIIGTFTADSASQTFIVDGSGDGGTTWGNTSRAQVNAIQLRVDATGTWSGAVNGNWDGTTANFSGGQSFNTVSGLTSTVVFGDDDGLIPGTPVVNSSVTIQASGVSIPTVSFINNTVNYSFVNASGTVGITGASAILKSGAGTVTFNNANTHTGNTTINAGTLALGASGSIANSPIIVVASGATYNVSAVAGYSLGVSQTLRGSGTVNGSVTAAVGQVVAGTAGTIGTLTFNNNLTLGAHTRIVDINSSTSDLVSVGGVLTLNGNVTLSLNTLAPLSPGVYTLFTYGSKAGAGNFVLDLNTPSSVTLNQGATSTTLTVGSVANLTWVGGVSANAWDVQTTANWNNGIGAVGFFQQDNVAFTDTGANSPAINLTTALTPGAMTFSATQPYTFGGAGRLTGNFSTLTLSGSGTVTLNNSGTNNFGGGVTINSGSTLQLGNNDANGTLISTAVANEGSLIFNRTGTAAMTNLTISGSGGTVVKNGSGTTILSGTGTFAGPTVVNNGTLQLNSGGVLGTSPIANNAALALSGGTAGNVFANSIAGNGTVQITGDGGTASYVQFNNGSAWSSFTGTLNIGSANPAAGARFVSRLLGGNTSAGMTINVSSNGQLFVQSSGGNVLGPVNVSGTGFGDGTGALRVDAGVAAISGPVTLLSDTVIGNGNGEISGVIDDGVNTFGFVKVGTGTLTLSAVNTYGGITTISNGTLALSGSGSIANSSAIVLAGGSLNAFPAGALNLNGSPAQTLRGSGNVGGLVTAAAGAQIIPGNIGVGGTLSFTNGLTLNGQTLAFDVAATTSSTNTDLLSVQGAALTLNGNSQISLNYLAGTPEPGVYTLINHPNGIAGGGTFVLAAAYPNVTLNVGATATTITVSSGAGSVTWRGDGTANLWDLVTANWRTNGVATFFAQGNDATLSDSGSNSPAINLVGSLQPASVNYTASKNYTLGGAGSLDGTGFMLLLGSGTLTINNSNSFTGGTTVSGTSTLRLGTNGTSGSLAGPIAVNSILALNHSGTNTVANVISGPGVVNVNGSGVEILTANNTYSGGTVVNAGVLQIESDNSVGTGNVQINNSATVNFAENNFTFSRTMSGVGTINIVEGTGSFVQFGQLFDNIAGSTMNIPFGPGSVRMVWRSNNGTGAGMTVNVTSNGLLYVQSGTISATLNVGGAGAGIGGFTGNVHNRGIVNGPVNLTGNVIFGSAGSENGNWIGNTIHDGGNGYSVLIRAGGSQIFNGVTASYSGNTTIENTTLSLQNGAAILNSPFINISGGATFDVTLEGLNYPIPTGLGGAATTQTLAGIGQNGRINGSVDLNAGGKLGVAVTGNGQPSLIVTNGTLTLNNNPVIITSPAPLAVGTHLLVQGDGVSGFVGGSVASSPVSGLPLGYTGSLFISNASLYVTVAVQPAITWVGGLNANAWDLVTANWSSGLFANSNSVNFTDTGSASPAVNVVGSLFPAIITVSGSQNYTFSGAGALGGGASLALTGSGTLTLNNNNTFTGGTTIGDTRTLQLGTGGASGTLAGAVVNNSVLALNHNTVNTLTNVISGTGSLVVNGSGTEILTGANTYTNGTTVNAGNLHLIGQSAAGTGPIALNSATLTFPNNAYTVLNNLSGVGVINCVSNSTGSGLTDYIQWNSTFDNLVGSTVNVPFGAGTARAVWRTQNGAGTGITVNVNPNGQFFVQSGSFAGTINVAGTGYGDNYGAFRLQNTTVSGPVNLTGNVTLSGGNAGTISGKIDDGPNSYAVTIDRTITYLGNTNTYGGNTIIASTNGATLALSGTAFIANSPVISISNNATFNVTAVSGGAYSIPSGVAGGAGAQTLAGSSQNGFISGSVNLNAGGSLAVTIAGDGQPSLVVANGTLTMNNNAVTVTSPGALGVGNYLLVQAGSAGAVSGSVASSPLSANLAGGTTGVLVISGGSLYLVVYVPTTVYPAYFQSMTALPGNGGFQMVFSGTNGNFYSILASTNVTLPVVSWTTIATGTFGASPVMYTDLTATNFPIRFYRIKTQ